MKPDRGEAMHDARRLDSLRKQTLVLAATEAALQRGCQPAIAEIARDAGVGRKFIYDHPELRAAIELKLAQAAEHRADRMITAARVTGASLRADLENSRAENGRLRKRLQALESRLSRAEGARIVADNLVPGDVLAGLADEQLARHVANLEQQLFEARESCRVAVEELEAARSINRELMQRANRSDQEARRASLRDPQTPALSSAQLSNDNAG